MQTRQTIINSSHGRCVWLLAALLSAGMLTNAEGAPTNMGQTGLVSMPTARVDEEGNWRLGLSQFSPFTTFWSSLSPFPRLELGARYTSIENTIGLTVEDNYGTFKDKAFDAKLMLLDESRYFPAVSIGAQDFLGTRVFNAEYVVLSKAVGNLDLSLGYGRARIDGYFGGIEYRPPWAKNVSLVYEYDALNYPHERFATTSGAIDYRGGSTVGIHYRRGWLGLNIDYQRDRDLGINAYLTVPLMAREFIPKLDEPPVFAGTTARTTVADWSADARYQRKLVSTLEMQGYKNVQLLLRGSQLQLGFSHPRISLIGRAVGRAARTALLLGPSDMLSLRITYFTVTDLPLVTYEFSDLALLMRFFEGQVTYAELLSGLTVSYADPRTAEALSAVALESPVAEQAAGQTPQAASQEAPHDTSKETLTTKSPTFQWVPNEDGDALSFKKQDASLGSFLISPLNAGIYFNDANGAFRYETFALAKYARHLRRGLFLNSAVRLRLLEDVSRVVDQSNSTLPHVRSDVADYKRDADFKLDHLVVNQFLHLRPRVYARLSAGYYEEMFAGIGGQLLYLPKQGVWATDLSVDAVKQRDTDGDLGFQDYETVTAIAAVHYQIPKQGLTFTLRGGQFLAKDQGLRYEVQRRFRSGVRIGAWYTVTDGNDITKPGSPDDPYRDKGIFVSIPLGSMLTRDTRATARFAIAPWTRDVGQMVKSPGDLYTILEDPLLLDWSGHHLLSDFHR